jgi:hypothetical protein
MEGYNATANSIAPLIGLDRVDPITVLMTFGPDIYLISFSAIRDSAGNDPNGLLLMGRKLGLDDLNQIKALTAYCRFGDDGLNRLSSDHAQNARMGSKDQA